MKRRFTLLLTAATCAMGMTAQVLIQENFNSPFNPTTAGWAVQNNSAPASTNTPWFQGNPTVFTAFNGTNTADYYANNFQQIAPSQAGTISSWLITPTTSITNGNIFQFATRIPASTATPFPDRLQVYFSTAGTATSVGTTTGSVGSFTNLILDINPNLTTNTVGTVSNGTVNGYPMVWTVYTMTLSGVTGTQTGRFAFRYFVTNGGPNGNNSNYIGIDAVTYSVPCTPPTIVTSPTVTNICAGTSTSLSATGGTSYIWSPGNQTTSVISVTPGITTIYTVTGFSPLGCPGVAEVTVNVTPSPTVSANNATTCAGSSATLTATGATSYTWQPGSQTSASIAVSPTASTVYTVTGSVGSCNSTKIVTVTIAPNLGINIAATSTNICSGNSVTLTADGATSYTWSTGSNSASIVVTPTASTTYSVGGFTPPSCVGGGSININYNITPTVSGVANPTIGCVNNGFTLTASGATNLIWSIGTQTFSNPVALTTTIASTYPFVITGMNGPCTTTLSFPYVVDLCTGIDNNSSNSIETSVFPNPFTNELNISGFSGKVEIYNTLGQVVVATKVNESEIINTASLPKGIYIIKTYDSEGKVNKTIRAIKN